ncbi:hypothetical protein LptCag_1545 [Leptospirillum ferriphilum]|uniref:DUF2844 domain-containing protein n=1 Tax=Leptospirillum ferriphilum TaxID=178606 RepID=A0A094WBF1_9BACT|nr:DUF2844 domain-containing protein [Leptospirillum ferriphilum]KGA93835.1 hypothetical protein LptCag_1545 [Leptospirillum ferriphilum]
MKKLAFLLFVLTVSASLPPTAFARLGGSVSSVAADALRYGLQKPVKIPSFGYTLYESKGVPLRNPLMRPAEIEEFAAPSGRVFGISWRLFSPPDFLRLLGVDPASVGKIGLHATMIHTPRYIIEIHGAPGFYTGKAVRIDLVPPGVDPAAVAP